MPEIRYYAPEPILPDDVFIVDYDKNGKPIWADYEGTPVEMRVFISDDSNSLDPAEDYDFSIPF